MSTCTHDSEIHRRAKDRPLYVLASDDQSIEQIEQEAANRYAAVAGHHLTDEELLARQREARRLPR